MRVAALYKGESELLLADLSCIWDKRTNELILKDPDILYKVKGPLWSDKRNLASEMQASNEGVNTTQASSSRSTKPKSTRIPEEQDPFFVKPPHPKSQEFTQMSELFSSLPKKHRKELATHIGYGEKRKHKH